MNSYKAASVRNRLNILHYVCNLDFKLRCSYLNSHSQRTSESIQEMTKGLLVGLKDCVFLKGRNVRGVDRESP